MDGTTLALMAAKKIGMAKVTKKMRRWFLRLMDEGEAKVYLDRQSMLDAKPTVDTMASGRYKVYGYWLSGEGVWEELVQEPADVKAVILPTRDDPTAAKIDAAYGGMHGYCGDNGKIARMATTAGDAGATVVHHEGFTGTGYTFFNPEGEDGWVHIEPIALPMKPKDRPVFAISRDAYPEVFARHWDWYSDLLKQLEEK